MALTNFRFDIDDDGIALLTWDMPNRSMNVITLEVMSDLDQIIDKVASEPAIKGCVITSGKEAFSGGADLTMLEGFARQFAQMAKSEGEEKAMQAFFDGTRKLSQLYRKLEKSGKPFVAAIDGVCLGGAFELSLACHYRILSDGSKTRVGLPEIKIGLFPGAGGTQRVARLMQTGDALQMLFKGDQLRATQAKAVSDILAIGDRRQGEGLDQGRRQRRCSLGHEGIPRAVRPRLLARRHDGVARRQCHLSPRDDGQLSRRQGHPARRL